MDLFVHRLEIEISGQLLSYRAAGSADLAAAKDGIFYGATNILIMLKPL